MKIDEILQIMQNKLLSLAEARKASVQAGDLARVMIIDQELADTAQTVEQLLKVLQSNA